MIHISIIPKNLDAPYKTLDSLSHFEILGSDFFWQYGQYYFPVQTYVLSIYHLVFLTL